MNATVDLLSPAPAPAEPDVITEDVVEAYSFSTGAPEAYHIWAGAAPTTPDMLELKLPC